MKDIRKVRKHQMLAIFNFIHTRSVRYQLDLIFSAFYTDIGIKCFKISQKGEIDGEI